MDKNLLEKIFRYNIYWLSDQKKFGDTIIQKVEGAAERFAEKFFTGEQLRDYRYQKGTPDYVKGSLIDNANSLALKESLRSKIFQTDVGEQFLKLSDYCIVNDFMRYKECGEDRLSRPLITFIAPKEFATKLRYLDKQELKYEYLSLDYKNLQDTVDEKRTDKPDMYRFNTMSDKFNNFLKQAVPDGNGDYFYYIPTELGKIKITDKQRIRVKDNFGSLRAKFAAKRTSYFEIQNKIRDSRKEIQEIEKDNSKSKSEKEDEIKKIKDDIKIKEKDLKNFGDNAELEKIKRSLSQLVVKDEYKLLSDYEYKGIMDRFKTRAETKLKVKI